MKKKLSLFSIFFLLCLSIGTVVYSNGAIFDIWPWIGEVPEFYGVGEFCANLEAEEPDIFYFGVPDSGFDGYEDFVDCVLTVAPNYAIEACEAGNYPPEYSSPNDPPKNLGQCVSGWKKFFNDLKKLY